MTHRWRAKGLRFGRQGGGAHVQEIPTAPIASRHVVKELHAARRPTPRRHLMKRGPLNVRRRLRFAFRPPDASAALVNGRASGAISIDPLAIALDWCEQRRRLPMRPG